MEADSLASKRASEIFDKEAAEVQAWLNARTWKVQEGLLYARESKLLWWDDAGRVHHVRQAEGVEQGDPLAPAPFALSTIHSPQPTPASSLEVLAAFLDDLCVVTCPARAREGAGVCANLGKTRVFHAAGGAAPPGILDLEAEVWRGDKPPAERGRCPTAQAKTARQTPPVSNKIPRAVPQKHLAQCNQLVAPQELGFCLKAFLRVRPDEVLVSRPPWGQAARSFGDPFRGWQRAATACLDAATCESLLSDLDQASRAAVIPKPHRLLETV